MNIHFSTGDVDFRVFRRNIHIFISHSSLDGVYARKYKELLEEQGFKNIWICEDILPVGQPLRDGINDAISKCDFFLLLVSKNSRNSQYVSEELGLATRIAKLNQGFQPFIIPILLVSGDDVQEESFAPFPMTDFEKKAVIGAFDLEGVRVFDERVPHRDDVELLARQMTPDLAMVGADIMDPHALAKLQFFELYESMFPIEERTPREQLIRMLFERSSRTPIEVKLPGSGGWFKKRTVKYTLDVSPTMVVLTLNSRAIGFLLFFYSRKSRLIFGNYLAVQACWRSHGTARELMKVFKSIITSDPYFADYRGVVFEIEPVDFDRVRAIVEEAEQGNDIFASEDNLNEMRKFLRLLLYEQNSSYAFFDNSRERPLSYHQPCLDIDKSPAEWRTGGCDLWLMFSFARDHRDFSNVPALWREALDFVVVDVYGQSHAIDRPSRGAEYVKYAQSVRNEALKQPGNKNVTLEKAVKSGEVSRLVQRWFSQDLKLPL